ncbi:MAG: hypothetical protein CMH54_05340 [Myxococcales bacterium]|nr:hypothetical protein [Myxococcales bacterium]
MQHKHVRRIEYIWIGVGIAWATLIWLLSSVPSSGLSRPPFVGADKVVHFLLFAVLGFAWVRGLRPGFAFLWGLVVLVAAYGVLDEWHQTWVPGRTATIGDVIADALGSIIGCLTAYLRFSPSKRS